MALWYNYRETNRRNFFITLLKPRNIWVRRHSKGFFFIQQYAKSYSKRIKRKKTEQRIIISILKKINFLQRLYKRKKIGWRKLMPFLRQNKEEFLFMKRFLIANSRAKKRLKFLAYLARLTKKKRRKKKKKVLKSRYRWKVKRAIKNTFIKRRVKNRRNSFKRANKTHLNFAEKTMLRKSIIVHSYITIDKYSAGE